MTSSTRTTRSTSTTHTAISNEKEVTPMTISVLDQNQHDDEVPTLTGLHDAADAVDTVTSDRLPCRVNDPELWFAESPADVEFAKALCLACPVRQLCLGSALDRREPWGVWGGELFIQGAIVARKRPRGRPRKNPVAA